MFEKMLISSINLENWFQFVASTNSFFIAVELCHFTAKFITDNRAEGENGCAVLTFLPAMVLHSKK